MRKQFPFLLLFSFVVVSCKKNTVEQPINELNPSFEVVTAYFTTSHNLLASGNMIGVSDTIIFRNSSLSSNIVEWDFGNGKTAKSDIVGITYNSPGTYLVTLTIQDNRKNKYTASTKIVVKERMLNSFSINEFQMNSFAPSQNGLPIFSKLDIWIAIKYSNSIFDTYTSNGDFTAPIVYQSPVFKDVDSSFHGVIEYSIPDGVKALLNFPLNYPDGVKVNGFGTILNLYGRNNTGTYLLASSKWSGSALWFTDFSGGNPNISKNFSLKTFVVGSPTSIKLNCSYQ